MRRANTRTDQDTDATRSATMPDSLVDSPTKPTTQTAQTTGQAMRGAHWSTASSASVPPEVCGVISTLSSSHSSGGGGPVNSPFCTRQHPRSVTDPESCTGALRSHVDIEHGAGDLGLGAGLDQGLLVHHLPPRDVDQHRAALHRLNRSATARGQRFPPSGQRVEGCWQGVAA